MVTKTLFEKLAFPGEAVSLKESVLRNIQIIFRSRILLDGENQRGGYSLVPAIVDQSADSAVDLSCYKQRIEQLILRFEPRIAAVQVSSLVYQGMGAGKCGLKIQLHDIELSHDFEF
jgi:predicted component of type VI protein secretion system